MTGNGERLFFVIGAPRSGTTLLMRMLNVHGDIHTRPEPHLMTPLAHLGYYAYPEKAPYDPFQSHQAAREFVGALPRGEEDYLDACRAYADTLYGRMLETTGKRYFLDKTPAYALVLPFLAKLYPNAVFVVITRHPFAIFSSYAESFFDDDWEAAHRFNPIVERYVPAIAAFLREKPVERLYHVRYEALVADPERELRGICAVAGLEYDPGMITYGTKEVEAGLGDPTGVKQHDRPTTGSLDKWARAVAGRGERAALLREMVGRIADADLQTFGTPREALFAPVAALGALPAAAKPRKWDRYAIERRLLLVLRRNIHQNALGRLLKRVRFVTDVLLRE